MNNSKSENQPPYLGEDPTPKVNPHLDRMITDSDALIEQVFANLSQIQSALQRYSINTPPEQDNGEAKTRISDVPPSTRYYERFINLRERLETMRVVTENIVLHAQSIL